MSREDFAAEIRNLLFQLSKLDEGFQGVTISKNGAGMAIYQWGTKPFLSLGELIDITPSEVILQKEKDSIKKEV